MQKRANVVIIGGGIIGASIAFNLAKMGCRDIVILEKEELLGMGSTAKCVGGIRQQFSSPINIGLSQESARIFENFAKEMIFEPAFEIDFKQNGYLFLIKKDKQEQALALERFKLQTKFGVPVRFLLPRPLKDKFPFLNFEDIAFGLYCAADGTANVYSVHQEYLRQARMMGVKIHPATEIIGIKRHGKSIKSLLTTKGEICAAVVINAAGPYAKRIGEMAGIVLPIELHRHQIVITAPIKEVLKDQPLIFEPDKGTSFYFKPETGDKETGWQLLLGGHMKEKDVIQDPDIYNRGFDLQFISFLAEKTDKRLKLQDEIRIIRGQAGLYTVTPDNHPILGRVPGLENFILAVGFSGHGFMHSPIVGRLIAELIVGTGTSLDITSLSLEAFGVGQRPRETCVI